MRRFLAAAALAAAPAVLAAADPAPKLAVLVVVDQMRADYVDRFARDWTSGLQRLVSEGAVFTKAAYPYLTTSTCAGHATLGTGAYPHTHGVFANTWFDRTKNAVVPCTDDAQAPTVSYGAAEASHFGPGALQVPTLADKIRENGGHVVTLALKARSAIMLAGHGGEAVTWVSDSMTDWETSTPYASAPVPEVKAFVSTHPMTADFGAEWHKILPADRYAGSDAGLAEDPPKGWTARFPHPLNGDGATSAPAAAYFEQWQRSPFADAYVARMAVALTESLQLGTHERTDFLGVSFSSPDLVGHDFGPNSHEIQDMYAHLDRSMGVLLDGLDRVVGKGAYTLALSADHGVAPIPEQTRQAGKDGGRIRSGALLGAAEAAARKALDPKGKYLLRVVTNDIYFESGMYAQVTKSRRALTAILRAIGSQPGVRRVFTAEQLAAGARSSDEELREAALSYVPGRSGDLVISTKPGWMVAATGTTHGSATADDQRVPIILYGAHIKAGRYDVAASPADVAPSLATVVNVALPDAEGRPLKAALR